MLLEGGCRETILNGHTYWEDYMEDLREIEQALRDHLQVKRPAASPRTGMEEEIRELTEKLRRRAGSRRS